MRGIRVFTSRIVFWLCLWVLAPVWAGEQTTSQERPATRTIPLTDWRVSLEGGPRDMPIRVPGTIENQIDADFDGVSRYEIDIPNHQIPEGATVRIRFEAVATHARVSLNGQAVGEHLGGWTPFEFDLTAAWQVPAAGTAQRLTVEVDERVGHNTQGFLPIVTNHFGGIWQPAVLQIGPRPVFVKDAIRVAGDLTAQAITVDAPLRERLDLDKGTFRVFMRPLPPLSTKSKSDSVPESDWLELMGTSEVRARTRSSGANPPLPRESADWSLHFYAAAPIELSPWSPDHPQRYAIRVAWYPGPSDPAAPAADESTTVTGFRTFQVDGEGFVLNDRPIVPRGILNWGYAPPGFAPSLDEAFMRREIEFAKARGFNLMKFCLWIPPKRYLELCDELGLLAWMEYPTWHPQLDQEHLADLKREYQEFFEYDRNHPAVVLRSLTCETGPSADLEVVRELYEQCKRSIPGAVVVDDSSWIAWNRVHDFYDDHPYGNNHTWVKTLEGLKQYIAEHEPQPLMLGEAIAADSWTPPHRVSGGGDLPGIPSEHAPLSAEAAKQWIEQIGEMSQQSGRHFDPESLLPQSLHYGQLMRKYQIETYRRQVPEGGYVVSVIRDFPKAAMGLIDFRDQPKLPAPAWAFHGDEMLLLLTPGDRRSFSSESTSSLALRWVGGGEKRQHLKVDWALVDAQGNQVAASASLMNAGERGREAEARLELKWPQVASPQRFVLRASIPGPDVAIENAWPVWVFPSEPDDQPTVWWHASAADWASDQGLGGDHLPDVSGPADCERPILARRFDARLVQALARGGRVLMIPDGSSGSFPLNEHWFLRGAPVVLPRTGDAWHSPFPLSLNGETVEMNLFMELQHFDLSSAVIPRIDRHWASLDPIAILWDNHDLSEVHTHGLVFEMGVGESGRCWVSCLNHAGDDNAAGKWLLGAWLRELVRPGGISAQDPVLRMQNLQRLRAEIDRQAMPLHDRLWKFRPDRGQVGVDEGWFASEWNDADWGALRTDAHWEGQGYADLDGWAWYRTRVRFPADWHSPRTYLNFTGIDDYADIYVNGEKLASVGDIASRQTAFEERISIDISRFVEADGEVQISVAVYDWYGAGGIFRPVSLSTTPLDRDPPLLK